MQVQTAILRMGHSYQHDFCNTLSFRVTEGWTVLSSGYSDHLWWAIIQKVQD